MKAELIDSMGNDLTVVNAARVSFAKQKEVFDQKDEKLISYLAKHGHTSPFFHIMLQFRITAPIFVARQWYRHTVGFARNEESRRYIRDEPQVFSPDSWRSAPEGSIKQGSGGTHEQSDTIQYAWEELSSHCVKTYNNLIEQGVAPEQARMILPQGVETSWVETASLYAYARLCNERLPEDAQKEIRDLAKQVDEQCRNVAPVSWEFLVNV